MMILNSELEKLKGIPDTTDRELSEDGGVVKNAFTMHSDQPQKVLESLQKYIDN